MGWYVAIQASGVHQAMETGVRTLGASMYCTTIASPIPLSPKTPYYVTILLTVISINLSCLSCIYLLSHIPFYRASVYRFCRNAGDGVTTGNKGLALVIPAGTADDISEERGGEKWARVQGFELVQLVPPRCVCQRR